VENQAFYMRLQITSRRAANLSDEARGNISRRNLVKESGRQEAGRALDADIVDMFSQKIL